MNLIDVAEDIMKKYEKRYQQIKTNLKRELENNKQYNAKVRKERDEQAMQKALKSAGSLKEEYMNALEKRLQDKEEQYLKQWERELAAEERKPTEEKTLDTMQLLLTQQVINGGNEKQINDYLMDNIDNRKVVEMMSYYYSDKEEADQIRAKINEALTSPHEYIDGLKGEVRIKRANRDLIDFGGISKNIDQDLKGNNVEYYFN